MVARCGRIDNAGLATITRCDLHICPLVCCWIVGIEAGHRGVIGKYVRVGEGDSVARLLGEQHGFVGGAGPHAIAAPVVGEHRPRTDEIAAAEVLRRRRRSDVAVAREAEARPSTVGASQLLVELGLMRDAPGATGGCLLGFFPIRGEWGIFAIQASDNVPDQTSPQIAEKVRKHARSSISSVFTRSEVTFLVTARLTSVTS
jgi:hypothetical protein